MQVLYKICRSVFMAVLVSLFAGNAIAKEANMLGIWCSQDQSEILYMQADGIGFNAHTMCDLSSPLPSGSHVKMQLNCANIYIHGNEIIRAFEEVKMFEAFYAPPNQLKVIIGDDADPILFTRCDE